MAKDFSVEEGKKLIGLARKSIQYFLATGTLPAEHCDGKRFLEPRGVFVSLHDFPRKELRGCIGFPMPIKPLWNAVIEAAMEAGFRDPRFAPLEAGELGKIVIEISVLTVPEEVTGDRKKLPEKIEVGKDGIIIQRGHRSGLFLPQVATEQRWGAKTFVEQCCLKAGLLENMWLVNGTKLFRFQAQVFAEKEPEGEIVEEKGAK